MFEFEANDAVILKQQEALEAALSTDPKTEKKLRKIIREYIYEAREDVMSNITFKHGDPRNAVRSIRTAVYKKVLGGNINILTGRKKHGESTYRPPRTLKPGQRGGNRRERKTLDRGKYDALDRGFILRWLNQGTQERAIRFTSREGRKADRYNKHPNTGYRGSIEARNFFRPLGDRAMGDMRDKLALAIETELADILNQK